MWIKKRQNGYPFSVIIVLLFIISFFSAHVVMKFAEGKEHDSRKVFAQKLSAEQDPLAEHLFSKIEIPMSKDTALINLLFHPHKKKYSVKPNTKASTFTKTLLEKYFSGYWEKYDIRISVFDTVCFPLVQAAVPDRDNLTYFEDVISSHSIPTESPDFFYLTKSSGRISYLARIPLVQTKDFAYRIGDLFIEFDSRVTSDEIGFPELLLDRKLNFLSSVLGSEYSYAKYKNGKLVTYHGKFPYGLTAENFLPDNTAGKEYPKSSYNDADNYEHLLYLPSPDSLVVISKKSESTITRITIFSYLFAFFSLLLLFLILFRILIFERKFRIESFRSRIQYVLVSIVLVSLLFFGGGTIYYIVQDYEAKNLEAIREKTSSALIEIEGKLGSSDELLASQKDYATYLLKKYSAVFFTDINLYSKNGDLLASSVSKIFDEGILSRKMCPEAYHEMAIHQKLEFINTEQIGKLNYLSAYLPFRNEKGEVLAFLNLPYFARQSELEKEISAILAAIINIYVLLFALSVIVAIMLSEYVTKPLQLIQEKLSKIKLGRESEPIEWKSRDELGSLVNEYNRMIDKLQKSAELLAKSERETAWREMAKQVAHEIKNPLTPMKLSIQHLQRTWKNKDDDMDKKIGRITETLIEQIETLSVIASEFSNFAQMPVTVNEKINMRSILENAISLFKDSSDAEIDFSSEVEAATVYADKEQLLRVFNNLLKNALQAIPENIQGKIQIAIERKGEAFVVKIKDNGTGINEEQISKIFTPNFTTKSGGMGLGLAMVKSIVETFNGKIWFETAKGIGTTFFVSIPEHREVNS
jgi:signal transduction histidine kinase